MDALRMLVHAAGAARRCGARLPTWPDGQMATSASPQLCVTRRRAGHARSGNAQTRRVGDFRVSAAGRERVATTKTALDVRCERPQVHTAQKELVVWCGGAAPERESTPAAEPRWFFVNNSASAPLTWTETRGCLQTNHTKPPPAGFGGSVRRSRRAGIPVFSWLSAKKNRARAIKNRRVIASKTRNRFEWRSIAARAAPKPRLLR